MLVRFVLLCDYTNESSDGKLNLIGVTDAVFAHRFPAMHKHCHLIVSYEVEPTDIGKTIETSVQLVDADGRALIEIAGPIPCVPEHRYVNHRHIIHDLQLPSAGSYQFTVRIEGREAASRPLDVKLLPTTA